MKRVMAAVVVVMSLSSGCARNGYRAVREADYPATQRMFDVTMGWKTNVTERGMTVDGYVRNTRYYIISDMDMIVSLMDESGREKARDTFNFIPRDLQMDNSSGFSVVLGAHPRAGDMIRFQYRYDALDARDGGYVWRHSFQVPALQRGN